MKQFLVFPILLLLLSSASLISARSTSNSANSPTPSSLATSAPAPSSNSDCSSIIFDMMDCLNYLGIGANNTKPDKSCCVGIESVLQYNPHCICVGLASSKQMGIPLNNTRALAVPSICKLSIAAPHCDVSISSASTPAAAASTPAVSTPVASTHVAPSTGKPLASSLSPSKAPSPSRSAANNLQTFSLVATIVSLFVYILALSN